MMVKDWMSQPAVAVDVGTLTEDADRLAKRHEIRMLPVLQNGRLVGIVTARDLRGAVIFETASNENRRSLPDLKVEEVMTPDPVSIRYDCTLEEAVEKLLVHDIAGLPVVNHQQQVIGVITRSDIFQLILTLTGYGKKGLQLAVEVEDLPESLQAIVDIIRDYGGRISSLFSTPEQAARGNRRLNMRIFGIDPPSLQHLREAIRKKATLLYIVDHNQNIRECF